EAHRQLVNTGIVDVSRKTEEPRAAILWRPKARPVRAAHRDDRRDRAESFHVVENRGALVDARHRRKGRTDAGNSALALERFHQRRFFTTLVCACAGMRTDVEGDAGALDVASQVAARVGLIDGAVLDIDQVAVL